MREVEEQSKIVPDISFGLHMPVCTHSCGALELPVGAFPDYFSPSTWKSGISIGSRTNSVNVASNLASRS